MKNETPRANGFRMPAEWEPQEATWLTWPKNPLTWPGLITKVQARYLEIISHLSTGQKVFLLVDDQKTADEIYETSAKILPARAELKLLIIPTADAWIRDYGPNWIVNDTTGERAINRWIFNAWGNKYPELLTDDGISLDIAQEVEERVFNPGVVLEGGSIDVNGQGLCLTTSQCLLNPNRNPQLTQTEIEQYLQEYLGVEHIIWLQEGIEGDDTDGHIDDIARFVDRDVVLCCKEPDPTVVNSLRLETNYSILRNAGITTAFLPMPRPIDSEYGPLPASYANFYIGNKVVFVPTFGDPADDRACKIIGEHFPGRDIIGIDSRELIYGLGSIHCLSQQMPSSNNGDIILA